MATKNIVFLDSFGNEKHPKTNTLQIYDTEKGVTQSYINKEIYSILGNSPLSPSIYNSNGIEANNLQRKIIINGPMQIKTVTGLINVIPYGENIEIPYADEFPLSKGNLLFLIYDRNTKKLRICYINDINDNIVLSLFKVSQHNIIKVVYSMVSFRIDGNLSFCNCVIKQDLSTSNESIDNCVSQNFITKLYKSLNLFRYSGRINDHGIYVSEKDSGICTTPYIPVKSGERISMMGYSGGLQHPEIVLCAFYDENKSCISSYNTDSEYPNAKTFYETTVPPSAYFVRVNALYLEQSYVFCPILDGVLELLNSGYSFGGYINKDSKDDQSDVNRAIYICDESGRYTNFGNVDVKEDGVHLIIKNKDTFKIVNATKSKYSLVEQHLIGLRSGIIHGIKWGYIYNSRDLIPATDTHHGYILYIENLNVVRDLSNKKIKNVSYLTTLDFDSPKFQISQYKKDDSFIFMLCTSEIEQDVMFEVESLYPNDVNVSGLLSHREYYVQSSSRLNYNIKTKDLGSISIQIITDNKNLKFYKIYEQKKSGLSLLIDNLEFGKHYTVNIPINSTIVLFSDIVDQNTIFEFSVHNTISIDYLTRYTKLDKLKVLCIGDSITEFSYNGLRYSDYLSRYLNCDVENIGIAGTRIAARGDLNNNPNDDTTAFANLDFENLIPAWIDKNYIPLENSAKLIKEKGWGNPVPVVEKLKKIDIRDFDVITILLGTNDYTGGSVIGELGGNIKHTINGAFKAVLAKIQYANPTAKIIIITPLVRYINNKFDEGHWSDNFQVTSEHWAGMQGIKIPELCEDIKNIAKYYHIPAIDAYWELGWNRNNFSTFFLPTDGTHPYKGFKWLGEFIGGKIKPYILQ